MSTPTMRYDVLSKAEIAAEKFVARQRALGRDVSDEERAQYVNGFLEAQSEIRADKDAN